MSAFSREWCLKQVDGHLQAFNSSLYATSGVTIASCCVCAAASGIMHVRWRYLSEDQKKNIWSLYGRFTLLSFVSSCAGAVAWGARMQQLAYLVPVSLDTVYSMNSKLSRSESLSLFGKSFHWAAIYLVTYAIDFFSSSIAKLLVLSRLRRFAVPSALAAQRRWALCGRIVIALVVVGNTASLIFSTVAAVYRDQVAKIYIDSSAAFAANRTDLGIYLFKSSLPIFEQGTSAAAFQELLETIVLLLIITAFVAVGGMGARLLNSALRHLRNAQDVITVAGYGAGQAKNLAAAAGAAGKQLRWKIVTTVSVVFVTLLLRAVFAVFYSTANRLQNQSCSIVYVACAPCWNQYAHMQFFFVTTPELQLLINLVATPLTLLVSLWGMTDVRALELMSSNRQELEALRVPSGRC
jgi:hypothetical protein